MAEALARRPGPRGLRQRLLLRLLGQQDGLDVGQNAALGDGHPGQQLVQLLVVADGQLQVTRDDSRLLVVAGGVSGQLEHFRGEVLEDGGQVDGGAGAHSLRVVALAQQAVNSAHRKLEAGARGARLGLCLHLAALAATGHVVPGLGGGKKSKG